MANTLDKIAIGKEVIVDYIALENYIKKRFFDIGLLSGTKITPLHKSPSGNARAYLIKGAIIAIRNADAKKITVRGDLYG